MTNPRRYLVDISTQPARQLCGLPHAGAYMRINEAFARVSAQLAAAQLFGQMGAMIGIYYDDISTVPEAELSSFAGFEMRPGATLPAGLEARSLAGGEEAVLVHTGPYSGLIEAYGYLFGDWLKQSGRLPAPAPSYEVYLNSPMDTAPDQLRTQIHVPLNPL